MIKKRVITTLWGIPLLCVAVWFDGPLPWFTILVAIWGLLAVLEFYKIFAVTKVLPLTYFGLIWTFLVIISPHFHYDFLVPLLLTSTVVIPLMLLLRRRKKEEAFISWAWTVGGILYVGWLLSYMVALRLEDAGRNWIFFALFITFASDSTAYGMGKAIGRHLLAPYISPSKTWEGAIAGVFGAIIVSLLFILPTPLKLPISYWQVVFLAILVSILGQLGDLIESLLKRNMGVKDSSQLIPGHGGALDRLDSILFAGWVVYYYIVWVV